MNIKQNPFAQENFFEVDVNNTGVILYKVTFVVVKNGYMANVQNVSINNTPAYAMGMVRDCGFKSAQQILDVYLKINLNNKLKN